MSAPSTTTAVKRLAHLALVVALVSAGCLSTPTGGTPTPGTLTRASNNPQADHSIYVENRWNRSVNLTLTVVRAESGDVVYGRTWSESPGGEHEVYNLERADPDGVESFRIVLELEDRETRTLDVATDACFGDAFFAVTERGDLDVTYSIC